MDRYLREFQTDAEYEVFTGTSEYLLPNVSWCVEPNHVYMQPYKHDNPKDYLTFTATEAGTFKLSGNSVNYSLNNGTTWTALASNTDSPTVPAGSRIMWKAELTPAANKGVGRFSSTGSFIAKGNPMSLLYGDNFNDQTDLTGKNYAYNSMFSGCTRLTTAPEIPKNMNGEMSYANPPTMIPTLPSNCLSNMFSICSSLNKIVVNCYTKLGSGYSDNWVKGVASTGDFYTYYQWTAQAAGDSTRPSTWTFHWYSNEKT